MFAYLTPYLLAFIPIFVAVDAIGNIPLFMSLVAGTTKKQRQKIIVDSITTATIAAILFIFIGKWILTLIGITIADFQIAGGLLLFIISLQFLMPYAGKKPGILGGSEKDVGVFPLGTPLITGPAVLTTTLMMRDTFGIMPIFVSLLVNMLFVWITLSQADILLKLMGEAGIRAFSKIMYILLAAIGVMMVRRGIIGAFF